MQGPEDPRCMVRGKAQVGMSKHRAFGKEALDVLFVGNK